MTLGRRIFSCILPPLSAEVANDDSAQLFPYWSFTKTVIAISALRLAENGKMSLDEPLREKPFTLRQLLNHTAGAAAVSKEPQADQRKPSRATAGSVL